MTGKIRIVALDLDGTLLDSRKNLSPRNRAALERIAVVWREISFDDGSKLEWDGSTWTLRGTEGRAEKLAFCNEVTIEGKKYLVRPFDQEEFIHPVGRYCRK